MLDASIPDEAGSLRTRRRLAEAALALTLVAALAAAAGTGAPVVALGGAVALAVVGETLVSVAIRSRVVDDADPLDHPVAAEVRAVVAALSDSMDLDAPTTRVVDAPWAGVTVLDDDGPTLVASYPAVADLERDALRGVVAHELAHLRLGHLDRLDVRDAVAHVVGLSACWVLILQHLRPSVALVGGAVYLVAAVGRANSAGALLYLLGSLGVVVVPLALVAYADRCEELAADDVAAAHAGRSAYARGLSHVTTMRPGGRVPGADTAVDDVARARHARERRGPLARLTARHPTLERRLERLAVGEEGDLPGTDS